jgi:hypothetical protein
MGLSCFFSFLSKTKKKKQGKFKTQTTSFLSTSEGEATFSFFLFLEKKAFTPNHQFGRQEKGFIHHP